MLYEKKNGNSWFTEVWLEYEGKSKNESKIEEKKKILREKVENESELINEIEVKKRTMESTKTVLNKMIEIDENLSETISSLSVQHFDKGSIEKFLQILKKEEDENRGILTDNL